MLLRTYGKLVNHPHINTDMIIRWRSEKISHDIENRKKRKETKLNGLGILTCHKNILEI